MANQDRSFFSSVDPPSSAGTARSGPKEASARAILDQLVARLGKPAQGAQSSDAVAPGPELTPLLLLSWRSAVSDEQGESFLASSSDGEVVICEGTPQRPGRILFRAPQGAVPEAAQPQRDPAPARVQPAARPLRPSLPPPHAHVQPQPQPQAVYLTSRVSGKRLAMDAANLASGARLVLQDANGGRHQRFSLTPQPHQGNFLLSASSSPLVINAAQGRRNHGWQLIEMRGQSGSDHVFAVEATADGDYRIRSPQSGRWLAVARVGDTDVPVLDASQSEEQASRWLITPAPATPRLSLLDLMSVAPRPKTAGALDVAIEPGAHACIDALAGSPFRAFAGDFLKHGRDQLLLVRKQGTFHHVDALDLAQGSVRASAVVEPGGWVDGWLGPNDLQLVGDLAGDGSSQLLLLRRGQRRPGEQAVLLGLQDGLAAPSKLFAATQSDTWLDGWLDTDDVHLIGDFMGLGHDQWLMLNRNPRGGRVRIVDIKDGSPRRCYTEMWGQSPLLDGWTDPGHVMLVGDFLKRGHSQVLFVNRGVSKHTGKMLIVDFCRAAPPVEVGYREMWGQSDLFDEFLGDGDTAVAGDFMGRGYAQALFVSRKGHGDKYLVADFRHGKPPVEVCVRETWGQRGQDAQHEALLGTSSVVLSGRFRSLQGEERSPAQVVLL